MSNDLWELRSTLDRGIARTFFTVYGGQIILLHGFMKKAQKNTSERVGTCQAPAQQVEVLVMAKKNVGSSFDEFLEEEGLFEGATAAAVKRVIAFQLAQKMSEHSLSKSEMARRMATSRSALDRLLDPDNVSVTLQTLQSAVQALGGRLNVEIDFDDHANAA
jgi:DNA-binding Xre family transcriptional regulator